MDQLNVPSRNCPGFQQASTAGAIENRNILSGGLKNAGQLLNRMLTAVGLDRNTDCYLSNIVHCRPPGNRIPDSEESKRCGVIVKNEILIIQPKVIFAVGGTAAGFLLGRQVFMTKENGAHYDYVSDMGDFKTLLVPIYHPAFIVRKGNSPEASDLKRSLGDAVREGLRAINHPKLRERPK